MSIIPTYLARCRRSAFIWLCLILHVVVAPRNREEPKWLDSQISEAFGVSTRTVERVRERLVQEGLESALNRAKPTRVKSRVIDGEKEAHLLALICGDAPEGRSRWTLRLLGQRMVGTGPCGKRIARDYPANTKKNELKPWQNKEWCISAKENAEFVCAMEDVLEVYKRSYDETHPLICMDESSKQHIKETRQPIPVTTCN